jgi:hypothetical protein
MNDVSQRKWWVRLPEGEIGPLSEDEFQARLRAGEFALHLEVRCEEQGTWRRLVEVVTHDPTFRRTSVPPPEYEP